MMEHPRGVASGGRARGGQKSGAPSESLAARLAERAGEIFAPMLQLQLLQSAGRPANRLPASSSPARTQFNLIFSIQFGRQVGAATRRAKLNLCPTGQSARCQRAALALFSARNNNFGNKCALTAPQLAPCSRDVPLARAPAWRAPPVPILAERAPTSGERQTSVARRTRRRQGSFAAN